MHFPKKLTKKGRERKREKKKGMVAKIGWERHGRKTGRESEPVNGERNRKRDRK